MVGVIGACYLAELLIEPPNWVQAARGAIVPRLPDSAAVTLAVGIFGATVMPHAIYLHSGLTQARTHAADGRAKGGARLLHYSNIEVVGALSLAGLVNAAMIMMAASAFHAGHRDVAQIQTAYHTLAPLLGGAAAFDLPALVDGERDFELRRGHHGGAGDHAGVPAPAHPHLGAAR